MRGIFVDVGEDARMMGRRVRQLRNSRGKSLRVVAGLAGMSKSKLSLIERGEVALDSRSDIIALANVLKVAPSELTKLDIPAPGDGVTDRAVEAVRVAFMAVDHDQPGGEVLPVEAVRTRVFAVVDLRCRRDQQNEAAAVLPSLIRDLHTSLAAGRDVAELLDLAVLLHTQGTGAWLRWVGGPLDLRRDAARLARQAAHDRDTPTARGIATVGTVGVMLAAGTLDLVLGELDSVAVPTASAESAQLAGMLALSRSLVAAADRRPADVDAAVEYAGELAQHTGEGNAYWMGFGPTNVGLWRMAGALEVGDYERAAAVATTLQPEVHPNITRRAVYWIDYGRALARLRGRQDDAVMALRRGEELSALHLQRNPFARDVLAELLARRGRRDALGVELRGMAHRAGLSV
ncbi:MAG: helix-turn-helix domain-containing protein [Pseudonocardiales bacterium]|nr:helix-turn-helix domain-containing protein [Pseudonocardiales bacterium]